MTRSYGTWAQLQLAEFEGQPGWRTPWEHIDEACGMSTNTTQYMKIATRYMTAINEALPDGVYLEDDTFYGPTPWISVDLDRIIGDVDLLSIVEQVKEES